MQLKADFVIPHSLQGNLQTFPDNYKGLSYGRHWSVFHAY